MSKEIIFSSANESDIEAIVALITNDSIVAQRESSSNNLSPYRKAFNSIQKDPNAYLIVAKLDNVIVGCLQINFIANLTYQGGTRALIEGVRIDESVRGLGLGTRLIEEAIARAREHQCCLVQLTTDKQRPEALKFYEKLLKFLQLNFF